MCKECVTEEMRSKIELCYDVAGGFSDGAWWAFCAERGVEPEDLVAYWNKHDEKGEEKNEP